MYSVDSNDQVIQLTDLPQSSIGAPIPVVASGEHKLVLLYYAQQEHSDWDGTNPRVVSGESESEICVVVNFSHVYASMFGAPNDEAFSGHPLASRGLEPYGSFRIENSSWHRRLDEMNSVHPYHDSNAFLSRYSHFVLSFHDSTFECIAEQYTCESRTGSVSLIMQELVPDIV